MSLNSYPAIDGLKPLLTRRGLTIAMLLLLFVLGARLRIANSTFVTSRSPDERWYSTYAARVSQGGVAAFPVLISEYIQDPTRHVFPPPWRIGYLTPLAVLMSANGSPAVDTGVSLSLLASLGALALVGILGFLFLPAEAAVCAMLLLAVSIADLALARRTWADSLLSLLGLVTVWAAWRITRNPGAWWNYALFVLAGGYSILVKETAVFAFSSCLLYVAVSLALRKAFRALIGLAVALSAAASLYIGLLLSAAGGLGPLELAFHAEAKALVGNVYGQVYQSGPWSGYLRGLWILQPANVLLAAAGMGFSILPDRWINRCFPGCDSASTSLMRLLSLVTAGVIGAMLALPAGQNYRYLAPVYAPICLLSGLALWVLLDFARRHTPPPVASALVVTAAVVLVTVSVLDYASFVHVYVVEEIPDLSVKMVLTVGR